MAQSSAARRAVLGLGCFLWWALFFFVEGTARGQCHVPRKSWVEAGADARERALRGFQLTKAIECLDATTWYSYGMGALFVLALVFPFVVVGLYAKRILRAAMASPVDEVESGAVLYIVVFIVALILSLAPYGAAQWFYDR